MALYLRYKRVATRYNVPVVSIISLADIMEFVRGAEEYTENIEAVRQYQKDYGI